MVFKRTIAAAAALAACGASAQSSVSISGVVDAGYSHGSGSIADSNQVTSGNNSTSRLIVRGREDLGDGLWAAFWLEGQFAADTGMGASTNTNNQTTGLTPAGGLTFNRRASIELGGKWGELRLGRDAAAHFYNRWESDPFIGIGVGATQAFVGSIAGPTAVRVSNAMSYFLPSNLGGVFGQAQYFLGENASSSLNADDGTGYSVRLGWASNAFKVSAHHGRTQFVAGDITTTGLAVSYQTPIARLLAGVFRDRISAPANNVGSGFTLGASVPMGASEFKVAVSRYGVKSGLEPTTRKLALGYVYNFSKRTAAYTTYARVSNNGGANRSLNGATTAPNSGSSGVDIGIRHNF